MIVKNIKTDTTVISENVRMSEQEVKCSSCGAEYTIETYLDKRPTVSDSMLARLNVHP